MIELDQFNRVSGSGSSAPRKEKRKKGRYHVMISCINARENSLFGFWKSFIDVICTLWRILFSKTFEFLSQLRICLKNFFYKTGSGIGKSLHPDPEHVRHTILQDHFLQETCKFFPNLWKSPWLPEGTPVACDVIILRIVLRERR
jgi:hypothetical protein